MKLSQIVNVSNQYRVMAVTKVETDISVSISEANMQRQLILKISLCENKRNFKLPMTRNNAEKTWQI